MEQNPVRTERNFIKTICLRQPFAKDNTPEEAYQSFSSSNNRVQGLTGTNFVKMQTQQDPVSQLYRQLQKLWLALQKMLKTQIGKERCIEFPLVGKFQNRGGVISYMPALDFLGSGHFKFIENQNNISPFNKSALGFQTAALISLTAICAVSEIDRESAASYLKQIIVEFLSQARQRKPCALQLGLGWLVANVEGELRFTNEESKVKFNIAEDGLDQDETAEFDIRNGSKTESVRFATMHESVKTPYTNIGNKVSVYNGRNRTLQNWYSPVKTDTTPRGDNYSMFSKQEYRSTLTEKKKSNEGEILAEALRDNQFVSPQTFEEFLARQKKGKKHFFLRNIGKQTEITKKLHDSYLEEAAVKREDVARKRFQNLVEENNQNMRISQEMDDLQEIECGLKQAKISKMRQNVYQGIQERRVSDNIQLQHRQLPGFTEFPYTHGDAVEEVRKELLKKRRAEEKYSGGEIRSESEQPQILAGLKSPKAMHFDSSQKEILIQKFLDTTPFFERKADCFNRNERRHTVEHNSSALMKARERFEKEILYNKLNKLEGDRVMMERQQQTYLINIKKKEQDMAKMQDLQNILAHQQELNQIKHQIQDQEKRELYKTNLGPEEPADAENKMKQAKRQSQSVLKSHFLNQMTEKTRAQQRQRVTELRVDLKKNQLAVKLDDNDRITKGLQQKNQRVNLIQNWVRQTQENKKVKL